MSKSLPICKHWWNHNSLPHVMHQQDRLFHHPFPIRIQVYKKKLKVALLNWKHNHTSCTTLIRLTVRLSFESLSIWRDFFTMVYPVQYYGLPFVYRHEERNCLNRTHSNWPTVFLPMSSLVRSINLTPFSWLFVFAEQTSSYVQTLIK